MHQNIEIFDTGAATTEQTPTRSPSGEHVSFPLRATMRASQEHRDSDIVVHIHGHRKEPSPSRQPLSASNGSAANEPDRLR